jgi:hypothetical protein
MHIGNEIAPSALPVFMVNLFLGRCPKLEMNRAFGAER